MNEQKVLEYEGKMHIRPMGRGIVLEDSDYDYLEDALAAVLGTECRYSVGWAGKVKLRIEMLPEPQS